MAILKIYRINNNGLLEMAEWLGEHYRKAVESGHGADYFGHNNMRAFAAQAEFQLEQGNPACIELKAYESVNGWAEEFEVSPAGIDTEQVEIDD